MADQISLDARGLEAALAILRREQTAYLPTERESKLYRFFNISAFAMALAAALVFVVLIVLPHPIVIGVAGVTVSILSLSTLVLFILNFGLILKLRRHAQLRRRLKVMYYFAPAFSARRKATRIGNAMTMLIIVMGVLLILLGTIGILLSVLILLLEEPTTLAFVAALLSSLAVIGVGLSLGSLHFVRRGKQRLEVVQQLQQTLAEQTTQSAQSHDVMLTSSQYAAIAGLERAQIIRDRASSIVTGRQEAQAPGYWCQTSRQMQEAKSKLPPELLVKVESAIANLLTDPTLASAADDPGAGGRTMLVADTALRIDYDVDKTRNLVRLHSLGGAMM